MCSSVGTPPPDTPTQYSVGGTLGEEDSRNGEEVFYWLTLYKDVENYCKAFEECQECSIGRETRVPLVPQLITVPAYCHGCLQEHYQGVGWVIMWCVIMLHGFRKHMHLRPRRSSSEIYWRSSTAY